MNTNLTILTITKTASGYRVYGAGGCVYGAGSCVMDFDKTGNVVYSNVTETSPEGKAMINFYKRTAK